MVEPLKGRVLPTADFGYAVAQLGDRLSGGEIAHPTGAGRLPSAANGSFVDVEHGGSGLLVRQLRSVSIGCYWSTGVTQCRQPSATPASLGVADMQTPSGPLDHRRHRLMVARPVLTSRVWVVDNPRLPSGLFDSGTPSL
jgi:hypothetical protein